MSNQHINNASRIINQLAERNITDPNQVEAELPHYVSAKTAFINIAHIYPYNLPANFEMEIRARHAIGQLSHEVFQILLWHLDVILAFYQQCLSNQPLPLPLPLIPSLPEKFLNPDELSTEFDCAICLGPHKKADALCVQACQHEFGKACLLEWQHVSKKCPLCRADAQEIYGYKRSMGTRCQWVQKVNGYKRSMGTTSLQLQTSLQQVYDFKAFV